MIVAFCHSEPSSRIVCATRLATPMPSTGAPDRYISSLSTFISSGERPPPPYSAGQPAEIHPWAAMARCRPQSWTVPVVCARSMTSSVTCSARKSCTSSRNASTATPNRKSGPRRGPSAWSAAGLMTGLVVLAVGTVSNMRSASVSSSRRVAEQQPCRLGAAEVELDVVLLHEPVAAVHVQRCRRDRLGGFARERQGVDREARSDGLAFVERPHGLGGQEVGAVEAGRHIGQSMGDGLERPDRYVELLALDGVLRAERERRPAETDQPTGGECTPLVQRDREGRGCSVARHQHDSIGRSREVDVAECRSGRVGHARRSGLGEGDEHELATVEHHDGVGDRTAGHEVGHAVTGRLGERTSPGGRPTRPTSIQ